MSDIKTMERTEILIDGVTALLAQEQDLDELLEQIAEAANGPAAFVDFVVVGNRRLRVLITPRSRVVVSTAAVQYDPRDTGDELSPWGGQFDVDWGHTGRVNDPYELV
ncbi:hypothetical protein [Microbacterium sp. W4I20]|uniref:hypothetical protein n=1 Tax=Microbacterium sp. W4I20 TaxID=3042262 RepID=UPI0027D7E76F|nr:hypothetical protein [Microbacterium sp. W4I20]